MVVIPHLYGLRGSREWRKIWFTMSMETFVEAEIWTVARTEQGNAVLLRPIGSDMAVPIFIGPLESQAILIGLGGLELPRPLTHLTMIEMMRKLGAEPLRAEINDLRDGTFYARMVIRGPQGEFEMDMRPSDALALVSRCHCPLYIAEDIVDQAGVSIQDIHEQSLPEEEKPKNELFENFREFIGKLESMTQKMGEAIPASELEEPPAEIGDVAGTDMTERDILQAALDRAVANENYEEAALIRDKLHELEGGA